MWWPIVNYANESKGCSKDFIKALAEIGKKLYPMKGMLVGRNIMYST